VEKYICVKNSPPEKRKDRSVSLKDNNCGVRGIKLTSDIQVLYNSENPLKRQILIERGPIRSETGLQTKNGTSPWLGVEEKTRRKAIIIR